MTRLLLTWLDDSTTILTCSAYDPYWVGEGNELRVWFGSEVQMETLFGVKSVTKLIDQKKVSE